MGLNVEQPWLRRLRTWQTKWLASSGWLRQQTWERVERDGKTRYYSKLAELCEDTEADDIEEYVPNNTFKRENSQEKVSNETTQETVEDNSSAEAPASAQ